MPPPKFVSCCFCSDLFGSASLPIHEKRCRSRPIGLTIDAQPASPVRTSSSPSSPASPLQPPTSPARPMGKSPTTALPSPPSAPTGPLQPCRHCGRTFDPARIAVHERVCLQARRQRPVVRARARPRTPAAYRAPSRWRQQHEALMAVVHATRGHAHGAVTQPPARAATRLLRQRHEGEHASPGVYRLRPGGSSSPVAYGHAGVPIAASPARSAGGGSPSKLVLSRGGGEASSSRVGSAASKRPTIAQRHAREWYESSQAAALPAALPSAPPRSCRLSTSPARAPPPPRPPPIERASTPPPPPARPMAGRPTRREPCSRARRTAPSTPASAPRIACTQAQGTRARAPRPARRLSGSPSRGRTCDSCRLSCTK